MGAGHLGFQKVSEFCFNVIPSVLLGEMAKEPRRTLPVFVLKFGAGEAGWPPTPPTGLSPDCECGVFPVFWPEHLPPGRTQKEEWLSVTRSQFPLLPGHWEAHGHGEAPCGAQEGPPAGGTRRAQTVTTVTSSMFLLCTWPSIFPDPRSSSPC